MKERLSKLLTVKSIVTMVLTAVFAMDERLEKVYALRTDHR